MPHADRFFGFHVLRTSVNRIDSFFELSAPNRVLDS
jgi:hypothetical protein